MPDENDRDHRRPRTPPTGVQRALRDPPKLGDPFEHKTPPLGSPAFRELERQLHDPNVPTIDRIDIRSRVAQRQTASTLSSVAELRKETRTDIERLDKKVDILQEHLLENTKVTSAVEGKLDILIKDIDRSKERQHKRAMSQIGDRYDERKMERRKKLRVLAIIGAVVAAGVAILKWWLGVGD